MHGAAHGFVAGRSILTNALAHRGAEVVVKVDLKDFFPTVTWPRVKGLLRKGGLPEGASTLLALLSTEAPREVIPFRGKTLLRGQGPASAAAGRAHLAGHHQRAVPAAGQAAVGARAQAGLHVHALRG